MQIIDGSAAAAEPLDGPNALVLAAALDGQQLVVRDARAANAQVEL